MPFPNGYVELLEKLSVAFTAYKVRTGHAPLLVGGAATAIMTTGSFMSGDFDIIAPDDESFGLAMEENGFIGEDRVGHMPKGFYHPEHPEYGFEQVSGQPRSKGARIGGVWCIR